MNSFQKYESEVSSYWRHFPCTFTKAKMSKLYDTEGKEYIDFFCGAGAMNYGHNNEYIMSKIIEYMQGDNIIHALDMHTSAKEAFLDAFAEKILKPRGLDYKMTFCSPSGTNANEAALKMCRKATGRQNVFSFMGAFHGMSAGSLALTSSEYDRNGAGQSLPNVTFMPYPFGIGETFDTIAYMEYILDSDHSGIEKPAAVIVETVQAEGGIVVAPVEWLRRLRELCTKHGIYLICDDIQVGCGRTGNFFSFERAGIVPDMVTLSKSIGGCGMPMSMVLLKPELDVLLPGQHNGTFRGFQPAFIGGAAALDIADEQFFADVRKKDAIVTDYYEKNIKTIDERIGHRGIGLIHGIITDQLDGFNNGELNDKIQRECFNRGLIIELAGQRECALKILPALTIPEDELIAGLDILRDSIKTVLAAK